MSQEREKVATFFLPSQCVREPQKKNFFLYEVCVKKVTEKALAFFLSLSFPSVCVWLIGRGETYAAKASYYVQSKTHYALSQGEKKVKAMHLFPCYCFKGARDDA